MNRLVFSPALAGALAAALWSAPALAQNCDPTTLVCSTATVKQKAQSIERLQTDIDTGWIPECTPATTSGHCGEAIQIRAQIAFDPQGATPVYVVDMPRGATIQVTWPTPDAFEVSLATTTTRDGRFQVNHTMTPEFGLYLNVLGFQTEINLDTATLVNLLPGAQFDYFATGSGNFSPWGFTPTTVAVTGTDLSSSRLFSVTFQQLGELVGTGDFSGILTGLFSFNATTNSNFTYTTTSVRVIGGAGSISSASGKSTLPMLDADYLEFNVQTSGVLDYEGDVTLLPVIGITSIAGLGFTWDFPINVGLDFPYGQQGVPVVFPSAVVHLPLPNVFVPSTPVDFGTIATGDRGERTVTIDNTGEMGGMLTFTSDDPQFSVGVQSYQMGPGTTYDLTVRFRPTSPGAQSGLITVTSNDPDTPVQTFEAFGFGEGPEIPGAGGAGGSGAGGSSGSGGSFGSSQDAVDEDGGCGCRAPGTRSSGGAAALGLAVLALRRRRRS